jgi:hypothetical protein
VPDSTYTLLIFSARDEVVVAQAIRAENSDDAQRIAELVISTRPDLAGYQLWHGGTKISATYPPPAGKHLRKGGSPVGGD